MVAPFRIVARRLLPRRARNWLRAPTATLRYVRDAVLHAAGRDPVVTFHPRLVLRCHPRALREAFAVHLHDPEQTAELGAFLAECRAGMVLLDAGAHYGMFSLAAASLGGPSSMAVAIDPSPAATRMVALHARMNGFEGRIVIEPAAVGRADGTLELVEAGVASAGYFVPPEATHPSSERQRVAMVSLDSLAARLRVVPTHLKIDVEGFEDDALHGALHLLTSTAAPLVFIELHTAIVSRQGRDPSAALRTLQLCGYRFFLPGGAATSLDEVLARPLVRVVARPPARLPAGGA